ncbi:hypothetical protein AABC73_07095 [Pseudomonas sp. G.S.17]|uniref:hypothetical protein n=1 Tax=Pseudomonas sp. G.S.17 TaxID=3137451 RepID=UPI00311C9072
MFLVILIIVALLVFFMLYARSWSARETKKSHLVLDAAIRSNDSGEPIEVVNGTTAAAAGFFDTYGTTQKKYVTIMNPVAYAGYVNLKGEEVVAIAFKHSTGLTIVTHDLPYQFGADLMGLMNKMKYLQEVLESYKSYKK